MLTFKHFKQRFGHKAGMYRNKTILVTGATGSFGQECIKRILKKQPQKIIIYSGFLCIFVLAYGAYTRYNKINTSESNYSQSS